MCTPIDCVTCPKTTWRGCGLHIPRAMDPVPKQDWCTCLHKSPLDTIYPPRVGDGLPNNKESMEE